VQAFAKENQLVFKAESKFYGHVAQGVIKGEKVHLLLPMTYMNLSGQSVRKVVDFYKISPNDVLIVSDDIALDFAQIRLRSKGGTGGHQGLKSIQSCLGTSDYPRLRVGIGDRIHGTLEDYVLSKFSADEMSHLQEICLKGSEAMSRWLAEKIEIAMNLVNVNTRLLKEEGSEDSKAQQN